MLKKTTNDESNLFWKDPSIFLSYILGSVCFILMVFLLGMGLWTKDEVVASISLMFLIIGVSLILYGRRRLKRLKELITSGKMTIGTVDEIYTERASYMVSYHYEINGKVYKKNEATINPEIYQEGGETKILYLPRQPKKAILANKVGL